MPVGTIRASPVLQERVFADRVVCSEASKVLMIHYLYYGACVVLLFGAAIFVHEFGHYWVARRCGMKVLAFAVGFGPKIFSWTRDGIEYSLRWIPAGGFVKLPQMVTGPMEG